MNSIKLSVKNIKKIFSEENNKETLVIQNVSMDIAEREIVCILGASGCGKSTFMKIIGGIYPATEGEIIFNGINYGNELPRTILKNFGFVFQSDNLLQWRTAQGNLKFILETMKLHGEKWDKRVLEMLDIVGLSEYKNLYPHELSGGMKQRVGIARALVHDPEILLLDQPFGALDAITRRMLTFEMLRIWNETQKTMVMVTNSVDEALLLAHRIYVFSPLPSKIIYQTDVDIKHSDRNPEIVTTQRFMELRSELNKVVRSYNMRGEHNL